MSVEDIIKQIDEERRKKYDQIEQKERQLKQTALANIRAVPDKNNKNHAKTPIFTHFLANSRSMY